MRRPSVARTATPFAVALALWLLALGLIGCETVEAVEAAPDEFWATASGIIEAIVADVLTILDWLL